MLCTLLPEHLGECWIWLTPSALGDRWIWSRASLRASPRRTSDSLPRASLTRWSWKSFDIGAPWAPHVAGGLLGLENAGICTKKSRGWLGIAWTSASSIAATNSGSSRERPLERHAAMKVGWAVESWNFISSKLHADVVQK